MLFKKISWHRYHHVLVVCCHINCHKCNIILKGTNREINWSVATPNYSHCLLDTSFYPLKAQASMCMAHLSEWCKRKTQTRACTHTHKPKLKRFLYLIDGNRIVMIIWVLNKRFKQICIICKRFVPRGWFLSLWFVEFYAFHICSALHVNTHWLYSVCTYHRNVIFFFLIRCKWTESFK